MSNTKDIPSELVKSDASEALIPIKHTLVDGVYTRVAYASAGTIIVGCPHKKGGTAILLEGTIQQIDGDDNYEISAPLIFNTFAGTQRMAKAITNCTYATCHSTEANTVEEAEAMLFEGLPQLSRIRASYSKFLLENKLTEEMAKEDMLKLPCKKDENDNYSIRDSLIAGVGAHANIEFEKDDKIGDVVLNGDRLTLARYLNHSDIPNCLLIKKDESNISLIAIRNISKGMELLIDYNEKDQSCQQ